MKVQDKEFVVIYLTDWQMRMIKDFLGIECHHWTVRVTSGGGMRYMGPRVSKKELDPNAKRMYFTDWQMREIKDATGEECEFVELHPGVVTLYGGPPIAQIGDSLARQ